MSESHDTQPPSVLDEEHRHVVADEVEVALACIELGREAADVANRVGRAPGAGDRREPHEHGCRPPLLAEELGPGHICQRLRAGERSVGAGAARMDDPLGNPLVVEPRQLLAKMKVLDQRRAAITGRERVVGVLDPQLPDRWSGTCPRGRRDRGRCHPASGRRCSTSASSFVVCIGVGLPLDNT